MNDTPPAVARTYREMLMRRSNAERFLAGCSMFATARAFVVASERERAPDASPAALRVRLFLRIYAGDFGPSDRARISARLGEVTAD